MPSAKGSYTLGWLIGSSTIGFYLFFPMASILFRMLLWCLVKFPMYGKLQTLLFRNFYLNFPHFVRVPQDDPVTRRQERGWARTATGWAWGAPVRVSGWPALQAASLPGRGSLSWQHRESRAYLIRTEIISQRQYGFHPVNKQDSLCQGMGKVGNSEQ